MLDNLLDKIVTEKNINATDEDGATALMYAACLSGVEDGIEMAKNLIKKKIDVNIQDNDGITALMYACQYAKKDLVQLLIENEADVNIKDNTYWSAFDIVIANRNLELAQIFLNSKKIDINEKFYIELIQENFEFAKFLLENGADINSSTYSSNTVLMDSILDKDYFYTLISNTKLDIESKAKLLSIIQKSSKTNIKIIQFLLDNGADVNKRNAAGLNAYNIAKIINKPYVMKLLLEKGANRKRKLNIINSVFILLFKLFATIVLHLQGLKSKRYEIWNSQINLLWDLKGYSYLDAIKKHNFKETFIKNISKPVKVQFEEIIRDTKVVLDNWKNNNKSKIIDTKKIIKFTPIIDLVKNNESDELIEEAIKLRKNEIDMVDIDRNTALFYAVKSNKEKIALLLLKNGANIDIINNKNQKVLDIANDEMEKLILNNSNFNIRPKIANILNKFSSSENLKYTNHIWDSNLKYDDFMQNFQIEWDEIKDDLKILSNNLHDDIEKFLFEEKLGQNDVQGNLISWGKGITIGFSSPEIVEWANLGNKPEQYLLPNPTKELKTFKDIMEEFKSMIVVKQNDKKLKLLKKFLDVKKDRNLEFDLSDLKEDKIDKFFTDVTKLEEALKIIFDDIENISAENKKIKVTAEEKRDFIEIQIIHLNSTSSKTAQQLLETIEKNGGNFQSIYKILTSLCDWHVDTVCSDGKRYLIEYLYPKSDDNKPHYKQIDLTNEGFTHILRFYK